MRLVQHKKEAYWFYRFLSIFYDKLVNPLFWTVRMRDEALELGNLNQPDLKVIDVGSGTGFTTEGIVQFIAPENVTCVDQSPHQMKHARLKTALQGCTFQLGDAENLPFETDQFDRYISAGSIEYWPDPQKGINEAFRVIKPDGLALMIGPLEPVQPIARFIANLWMLFPKEEEYKMWFNNAGFTDVRVRYVKPVWVDGKGKYGIAISGRKQFNNPTSISFRKETEKPMSIFRWLKLIGRLFLGSLAGFLFIPAALWGYFKRSFGKQEQVPEAYRERLNTYQITALLIVIGLIGWLVYTLF